MNNERRNHFSHSRNRHGNDRTGLGSSLYNFYLRHNRPPGDLMRIMREHVNMNSYDVDTQRMGYSHQGLRKQEKKVHKFRLQLPNSDIFIEKELEILTNVHSQDLIDWTDKIHEIKATFHWDDNLSLQVLRASVSDEIASLLSSCPTFDTAIRQLFSLRYTEISVETLYREANTLHQDNFLLISDYNNTLNKIVRQIGIIKQWPNQIVEIKYEEYFYMGLSELTRLEINKQNIQSAKEVLQTIQRTEELLIKVANEKQLRDSRNTDYKWCEIHKSRSHSTNECNNRRIHQDNYRRSVNPNNSQFRRNGSPFNSQRRNPNRRYERQDDRNNNRSEHGNNQENRQQNNNTSRERSYAVRETYIKMKPIILSGSIENHSVNCLMDSGSNESYISEELSKKVGLELIPVTPRIIEMANNDKETVENKINTRLKLDAIPSSEYKIEMHVMRGMELEVILGINFLQKFNCVLDFKKPLVTIDEKEIEIVSSENVWKNSPDQMLTEKSRICATNESPTAQIETMVERAKRCNPKLGYIREFEHKIILSDETSFGHKSYAVPISLESDLRDEIRKLLEMKVIVYSDSQWISPAFPILKKNGKIRLIIDYRKLNSLTVKDVFPIPEIKEKVYGLRGSKIFSIIDLNMGYYQLKVERESRKYTAFVLDGEVYEFTRMPFGLTNAPRTFQRAITKIVRGLSNVEVFMDDIVVHSPSLESHVAHLQNLLERLEGHGISINFEKCRFAANKVKYLGLIVDDQGIRPDTTNILNLNWKPPKTKKQLERILGLINWFRPFIQGLSEQISEITERLKDKCFRGLTQKEIDTVQRIFAKICSAETLSFPDESKPYILETDASENAIGGVLLQQSKVIGFYSKKLSDQKGVILFRRRKP